MSALDELLEVADEHRGFNLIFDDAVSELAALRARAGDSITRDAIIALTGWALKQNPPLSIIAACDRALWWSDRIIDTNKGAE